MTGPTKLYATGDTDWMSRAACTRAHIDMFPTDEIGRDHAVSACAVCSVRERCLDYALTNRVDHGVWGGLSERERRAVLRRQKVAG